jgi:MerR family transcriptional regulator, copper efflux regulator
MKEISGGLRSGQLAQVTGVSTDTLRYYERRKVLPKPDRTSGQYRLYSPESVERVLLIRRALALGFSINELARIFETRAKGGVPCHDVATLAHQKLDALEEQIQQLLQKRKELKQLVSDWDAKLARLKPHKLGRLLESIPMPDKPRNGSRSHFLTKNSLSKKGDRS